MKVMLLAAGRGERMGALTENTPKPLLEVAGKPLLFHHIERLKAAGFKEMVINTSYLGEQIRDYVGDGSQWGVNITCTNEPQRLETAGGIVNALPLLGEKPFLVVNSDVWMDYPFEQLNKPLQSDAHLVLVSNPEHNPEGDFYLCEKTQQVKNVEGQQLTFSGVSVLSPQLFMRCEKGKQPLAPVLRDAIAANRVTGEHYKGVWIDVGTPERLQRVAKLIEATQEDLQ